MQVHVIYMIISDGIFQYLAEKILKKSNGESDSCLNKNLPAGGHACQSRFPFSEIIDIVNLDQVI